MFQFTPLLGAQSDCTASQSLIELDGGVKILVDVGWDGSFDPRQLQELERHVSTLSLILLTHATSGHLAAYAHCCKHVPHFSRIPVYATTPVISLGRTLTLDLYRSTPLAASIIPASSLSASGYGYGFGSTSRETPNILLPPPTPEEIASYFAVIHPLKYSQSHQPQASPFSPPLNGLTITPYSSGHTVGGAIWHIQHGLESIVYAVDWNQARENVVPGAAWLGGGGGGEVTEQLRKPTAMVCSSRGAGRTAMPGGRKKRDETLLAMIRPVLAQGGTVLIPTDSSARVIELAYLLEHAWRAESGDAQSSLRHAQLYLAARSVGTTMRYARSMLEWMDESIVREFEAEIAGAESNRGQAESRNRRGGEPTQAKRAGPFDFQHLQLLERRQDVERVLRDGAQQPTEGHRPGQVILASDTSLRWGFSVDVFREIASDARNLVVLTERLGRGSNEDDEVTVATLGQSFWDWWEEERGDVADDANDPSSNQPISGHGRELQLREAQRMPLEGNDLLLYQQFLATRQQMSNTLPQDGSVVVTASVDVVDDVLSDDSSSDESDSEHQGRALNISAAMANTGRSKTQMTDEELGINILLRRVGIYDYGGSSKVVREHLFPGVGRRRRGDEFGEMIRPEDFLKAEERDEDNGPDGRRVASGKGQTPVTLGQKRKWGEVDDRRPSLARRPSRDGGKVAHQKGSSPHSKEPRPTEDDMEVDGTLGAGGGDGVEDAEDGEVEEVPTGPSKVVFNTETVPVHLGIAFVDFSGLHDKRSLHMLIPLIAPRKLIIVEGSKEETMSLAADCRRLLSSESADSADESTVDVFTPIPGRTVDASVDTHAWTVKLSEALVRRLRWQSVRGLGVVHIHGNLHSGSRVEGERENEQGSPKRRKTDSTDAHSLERHDERSGATTTMDATPVLDLVPANLAAAQRSLSQPLHVGDLRLADLKRTLQASGHAAEFRGEGVLLIDNLVSVRKLGTGRIEVEAGSHAWSRAGPASRLPDGVFNDVKRRIYEGLAVVAGA
ncbi:MAG: hypothetical protein M1823_003305 [Watsoniomyces obsoletus]|nr:MAG: hypothetical protein M1823_003305 [Watsoniomyces obsoletus]